MKLYVGCALTHAPQEFQTQVELCKRALREYGYDLLEFIGLSNGTAADVYAWDIKECVDKCDAMIVIADYPSIGLGWETGRSVAAGKPVIAVAHKDARITRLVLGAAESEENFIFARYTNLSRDVPAMVESFLAQLY